MEHPKLTRPLRSLSFMSIVFLLSGICVAQSAPEPKSGLAVSVQTGRAVIKPEDPVVLRVTFRNVSTDTFRLPDRVNPPDFNRWYLSLRDVNSGKRYTGISTLPMGAASEPVEINPVIMAAGDATAVSVAFQGFAFVPGDMTFQAARNAWFPQRLDSSAQFKLPAGHYEVAVNVQFRSFLNTTNLPERIKAAKEAIENNPIPLWKGDEVRSNAVPVEVRTDAVVNQSEIVQIGKDTAGSLLEFLQEVRSDSAFVSARVHTGLWNDLDAVGAACNGVLSMKDSNQSSSIFSTVNQAINQVQQRSLEISQRSNESEEVRTKARQLASTITKFTLNIER